MADTVPMASFSNADKRLNLQEMMRDSDDNTEKIRTLRHSSRIRADVARIVTLKRAHAHMAESDPKKYEALIISHCGFLWQNYTNIFNRLLKGELSVAILDSFLDKLGEIEDGGLDQMAASVDIGQLLKKLYIDSALKRAEKIKAEERLESATLRKPSQDITWGAFKQLHGNSLG